MPLRQGERVDTDMIRETPPIRVVVDRQPILANIANIRKKADGEWYRIARFDGRDGGANLRVTLRKHAGMERFDFKSYRYKPTDSSYGDGWRSALYCRWAGAPGKPGVTAAEAAAPKFTIVEDPAREDPPARRRRQQP